jgi:hypothetical protein
MTLRERAVRRMRQYHCKACANYFPRKLPYCPVCKIPKGSNGQRGPNMPAF